MIKNDQSYALKNIKIGFYVALIYTAVTTFLQAVWYFPGMAALNAPITYRLPGHNASNLTAVLTGSQVATLSYYVIGISIFLMIIIALAVRFKSNSAVVGFIFLLAIASSIYYFVTLGNIFWELWGGWAATIGYVLGIGIGVSILGLVLAQFPQLKKSNAQ